MYRPDKENTNDKIDDNDEIFSFSEESSTAAAGKLRCSDFTSSFNRKSFEKQGDNSCYDIVYDVGFEVVSFLERRSYECIAQVILQIK